MESTIRRIIADRSGATAIEYSLICALVFLVIIAGMTLMSNETRNSYNDTAEKVGNAMGK